MLLSETTTFQVRLKDFFAKQKKIHNRKVWNRTKRKRKTVKVTKNELRNGSNLMSFICAQALNRCRFIFAISRYFDHQVWDVKQTISKNILLSVESLCQTDLKSSMLHFDHHSLSKTWLRGQVAVPGDNPERNRIEKKCKKGLPAPHLHPF